MRLFFVGGVYLRAALFEKIITFVNDNKQMSTEKRNNNEIYPIRTEKYCNTGEYEAGLD